MDTVACRRCQMHYQKRRIVSHESTCKGGPEGFTPVHKKERFVYRCHTCGLTFRKQNTGRHRKICKIEEQSLKPLLDCVDTALSSKQNKEFQVSVQVSPRESDERQKSIVSSEEEKEQIEIPFIFEKSEEQKLFDFYCPVRKEIIRFETDLIEEEEISPHSIISSSVLEAEKRQSRLTMLTQTQPISCISKLKQFRQSKQLESPSIFQSIEIYGLSCFLRLIGRFTRDGKWELSHGLIKKSDYWSFLAQAQPWISNNKTFTDVVEQKLKYFVHDDENFIVTNFEFVYQRIKGLIENFHINPKKLEQVFTRPITERKKHKRIKRKNQETQKLRKKLIQFRYRLRNNKNKFKNPYGIRKMTKLKYQAIKYQTEAIDQMFYMKQVFRKRPSQNHRAQIRRKRQRLMINFCMSSIADELTAAVLLGEFKIWTKSIDSIDKSQRYLYADQIPSIPTFQIWYPLTMQILKQWKWYYPYAYQRCSGNFESPLPHFTQDQLFQKLCQWYRSKGLIINNALYQLNGFDQIRALLDKKYRIEQEKIRDRKKNLTFEVNPRIIFPEDQEESSNSDHQSDQDVVFEADVPVRGDPEKWKFMHQSEHLTGFNICSICLQPLIFPAPTCQLCLTAYHYKCRREFQDTCLCQTLHTREQNHLKFNQAIQNAKKYAKHVDFSIKAPPKASLMELKYQKQNLQINMEVATQVGLWCFPSYITYQKSNIPYLRDKSVQILETFGKSCVFPGSIENVQGKGRGVIATRQIKKSEIVAIYPGRLVSQAQIIKDYKNCHYIFNFQDGMTPFSSWAIVPQGFAHLGMFINHGTQNVTPSRFWSRKGPLLLFISNRVISMGEEILYDYGPLYNAKEAFH